MYRVLVQVCVLVFKLALLMHIPKCVHFPMEIMGLDANMPNTLYAVLAMHSLQQVHLQWFAILLLGFGVRKTEFANTHTTIRFVCCFHLYLLNWHWNLVQRFDDRFYIYSHVKHHHGASIYEKLGKIEIVTKNANFVRNVPDWFSERSMSIEF